MSDVVKLAILSLKQEIRCSLCLGILRDPVTTKCFHNFCRVCADTQILKQSKIKCPNCKANLTKKSFMPNEKLTRIVAAVVDVIQSYNKDLENNGFFASDKLYLSQTQVQNSCRLSQSINDSLTEKIRLEVKFFDDEEENSIDDEPNEKVVENPKIVDEIQPEMPQIVEKSVGTVPRTTIWKKMPAAEVPAQSTSGDPYEFIPSQKTPTKNIFASKKQQRGNKGVKRLLPVAEIKKPPVDLKKRKLNEDIAKQNEFYETVIGGQTTKDKLKVKLKLPKLKRKQENLGETKNDEISVEKNQNCDAQSTSRQFVDGDEWLGENFLEKERNKEKKRKSSSKKVTFADWTNSQVVKMDEMNKEFKSFEKINLNVVEGEKTSQNVSDAKKTSNDDVSDEISNVFDVFNVSERRENFVAGNTKNFVVSSLDDVNSLVIDEDNFENQRENETETSSDVAAPKISSTSHLLFQNIVESQMSTMDPSQNDVLAGDSELFDDDERVAANGEQNCDNIPDSQNDALEISGGQKLLDENPAVRRSILENIRSTQEVEEFADIIKTEMRRERIKSSTRITTPEKETTFSNRRRRSQVETQTQSIENLRRNNDDDSNILASLLQSFNSGEWRKIQPSNKIAEETKVEKSNETVLEETTPKNDLPNEILDDLERVEEEKIENPTEQSEIIVEEEEPIRETTPKVADFPSEILQDLDNFSPDDELKPMENVVLNSDNSSQSKESAVVELATEPSPGETNQNLNNDDEEKREQPVVERLESIPDEILQNLERLSEEHNNNPPETTGEPASNDVEIIPATPETNDDNFLVDNDEQKSKSNQKICSKPVESSTQILAKSGDVLLDEFSTENPDSDPFIQSIMISPIPLRPSYKRSLEETTPSSTSRKNQKINEDDEHNNSVELLLNSVELTQAKKFVLCFSGFSSCENNRLSEFCEHFGCETRRQFDRDVTHLVTKTKNVHGNELCERTLKYFQSMAARIWIISHQWVERSIESNKLLPVDSFIVNGDTADGAHNGPEKACTVNSSSLLFTHISFFCVGPFDNFENTAQLEELLKQCGGEICESLEEIRDRCSSEKTCYVVVQEGEQSIDYCDDLYTKYHVPVIDVEYVLICLSRYTVVPVYSEYLMCSKELLAEDYEMEENESDDNS